MANLYNMQRRLSVVMQSDGATMYNGRPVIGLRDVGGSVQFEDNQIALGCDVLTAPTVTVANEMPILGAVLIGDGRDMYNGQPVMPAYAVTGSFGGFDLVGIYSGGFTGDVFDFKTSPQFSDAGTTPAADGQGVYRINGLRGTSLDQPTAAARPVKSTSGLACDGADDYFPTAWTPTDTEFTTVSAFYIDPTSTGGCVFAANISNQRYMIQFLADGSLRAVWGGAITDIPTGDLRGAVHTIAMTKQADNNKRVYLDGTLIYTRGAVGDGLGTNPCYWGASNQGSPGSYFKGNLRGQLWINRLLTVPEITAYSTYWNT